MSKVRKKNSKYFDEDKWEKVDKDNKYYMEAFLDSKRNLSDKSLEQYRNALQIFFIWVLDDLDNEKFTNLKRRDTLRYQSWLLDQGLSTNAIKSKRSPISGMCNFIMTFYDDKFPTFKNIVDGVEAPPNAVVHKKEPLTIEELKKLRVVLTEQGRWQQLAYLEMSYSTGGRREEIKQLRKDIVDSEPNESG